MELRKVREENRGMWATVKAQDASNPILVSQLQEECERRRLSQVAAKYGMSKHQLMSDLEEAGALGNNPTDPTPDQIRREAAAIRRAWTDDQARLRWVGHRRVDGSFL